MPNETPDELRAMAEWYRSWAEIAGASAEREHRLALADCLDRMASEREQMLEATPVEDLPSL